MTRAMRGRGGTRRPAETAPGVYRLGRAHHNFYLIVEGGRATVVDAGGSRELPLLLGALAALDLHLEDVEAVLITHAHTDHLGFAREVAGRGVAVKVHEDEARYATERSAGSQVRPTDLPLWRPRAIVFVAEMVRAGAHRSPRLDTVVTVTDGERLDLPGRPRVLATPGHTRGHASYVLEDRRAVCSGDALVTDGIIAGSPGPRLLPDRFHLDPAAVRASLERLAGVDAELLLPGHGLPWHGPIAEAVAAAGRIAPGA